MSLEAYRDSLDELDEHLKSLYVQEESGKWRLDVEGGFKTLPELDGLTSALSKERSRAEIAEKTLKERERVLQEKEEQLKKQEEARQRASETESERAKREYEAALQELRETNKKYETELAELKRRESEQAKRLLLQQSGIFDTAVSKAIRYWMENELPKHIVVEEGNTPYVVDEKGNRMYDEYGNPMDTVKALKKLSLSNPDGKSGLKSEVAGSGSGASSTVGGGPTVTKNPWSHEHRNVTEQCRIFKENPALAKQLMSMAGH